MKDTEEVKIDILRKIFTDFNGDFDARLSHVASSSGVRTEKGMVIAGPTRFVCRIKVNYKKELMKKLREGMILAVRNFKAKNNERYTLMEISRFWPEHFGLKGVSDELYYPIQREIIEQSSKDWDTDDTSTMMIQLNAIPINYDLIVRGDELEFENGWTFPIIGEKVNILNRTSIAYLFNKEILKKLLKKEKITIKDFEEYERKLNKKKVNPRIGVIQMFTDEEIPLLVDFEDLIRYHFGVFAFTGGGKSNLVANLIRKAYHYEKDIKILIFDISCEYIILLLDLLCKEDSVKIVLDKEVKNVEELDKSVVKPKIFEKEELLKKIKEKLHELMKSNKIKVLKLEEKKTYGMIIDLLTKA
ncbi:MAG: DUF87 domain-containing protein, partial [Candidatus Odinarchaeota archaeon]|nr:DUF87 domain-containing protein [Candidatus Odinarchaeota archaeon]